MKLHRIGFCTAILSTVAVGRAADIDFPDFSSVGGLTINGDASQQGSTLQLTPPSMGQAGSVFSTAAIGLNNQSSFSTRFQFQITDPGGSGGGADGLVFVVQTQANNVGAVGGGIGYSGISPSVGIEFDTYDNGEPGGGNHVGINSNGSVGSITSVAEATLFDDGNVWTAWVDYNGATEDLEVRYNQTGIRPASAALSANLDLAAILGMPDAFVGFTSGTGHGWGDHRILNWQFVSDFNPIDDPDGSVPDGGSTLMLLSLASVIMLGGRRLRRK